MTSTGTSRWVDLEGGPIHFVDHGGNPTGPPIVLVHGLSGNHLNWDDLAPLLTSRGRVLALDLIGHGRSRAHGRSADVHRNRRVLDGFLREVAGEPAVVVGNSMGGLITLMQLTQAPETVRAAALIDPALPLSLGGRPETPVLAFFAACGITPLGRRILASGRGRDIELMVKRQLNIVMSDRTRMSPELYAAHVALATERAAFADEADQSVLEATKSLLLVMARLDRYRRAIRRVTTPTLLIHGTDDRLVHVGQAKEAARLNPAWELRIADGLGHVPMMEDPAWTARELTRWLDALDEREQRTA
ncbi:alpha/beta fold hydrolase [Janibacter sp. G1551]|uniref:alpha/beta fold hydrolase n=1 Tax=Janibacter sp. G1551 TaxID=3420440 RepID=UPI003CFE4950